MDVAWSPDSKKIASASSDGTILIWDCEINTQHGILIRHNESLFSVSWSPTKQKIVSGYIDKTIILWSAKTLKTIRTFKGHKEGITSIAFSPNGKEITSGSRDNTVRIWDATFGEKLILFHGHSVWVTCITWSPDGRIIAFGSCDNTIRLWDATTGHKLNVLEGHTGTVNSVSFNSNGSLLASKSIDNTVQLWNMEDHKVVAVLQETVSNKYWPPSLAFHPTKPILATLGEYNRAIRIWELDIPTILKAKPAVESIKYTTARIVLVGDSGVGKTGLGWRMAHDEFKEHSSTHGQQFWVIDELSKKRKDGIECEAVLWDLAGQPDYRLIHSLFLDDVDLALVLFDPSNRENSLIGVNYWLKQLKKGQADLCNMILVGARTDRGAPTLTETELAAFCQKHGIKGGFIATSAKQGQGLKKLLSMIREQIPWENMPATTTMATFKRIKEYVLSLKEAGNNEKALITPATLRRRLEKADPDQKSFTDDEMMTAVRHLETHGYVAILRRSNGETSILLSPDLLTNLASSFVLEARRNPRGLGVLEEDRLLRSKYHFPELTDLSVQDREILLDAATVLFIKHNICFRETFNERIFLIFPSLINEKRPIIEEIEIIDDVSYRVSGASENVYASLVVQLGYTNTFTRTHQWQNQAQYQLKKNEICGFRQTEDREGIIELLLYYGTETPDSAKLMFQGMFEMFLNNRNLAIERYKPVECPKCAERLERSVVINRLKKKEPTSFCTNCGQKLNLPSIEALTALSRRDEKMLSIEQEVAKRRTAFEAAIVHVKGLIRERDKEEKPPTCFISYAWGVSEHERWTLQIATDLRNAGIDVLFDRWHNPPGSRLSRFLDKIHSSNFVIVIGTPELRNKYESETTDPVVAAELELINTRLRQPKEYGDTVIPLLLSGESKTAFTPGLHDRINIDFRDETLYFVNLFDLIWRLFELPSDNPLLDDLRDSMSSLERKLRK